MMAHSQRPEALAAQARIMADAGCQCVYVVDSAGAMILEDVPARVGALVAELGGDAQVGFHGHENLAPLASPTACWRPAPARCRSTARRAAFGAGAGNTPLRGASPRWPSGSASAPASTC